MKLLVLSCLAAAVLLGVASGAGAQPSAPASALQVEVETRQSGLPLTGVSPLNFTVTVGCAELTRSVLAHGEPTSQTHVHVGATGPEWLTLSDAEVPFDLGECGEGPAETQGVLSKAWNLTVRAALKAPGLKTGIVNVTASLEQAGQDEPLAAWDLADLRVVYAPGFTVTTDPKPPFTVRNGTVKFDVVVRVTANAETTAMYSEVAKPKRGTLSGFPAAMKSYPSPLPNATVTEDRFAVTYTSTTRDWKSDYGNYTSASHASASMTKVYAGPDLRWVFKNGDEPPKPVEKDSPGLGVLVVAGAGLAGAAWTRRVR